MATVCLTDLSSELSSVASIVRAERDKLTTELTKMGAKVTPSEANFVWVKTEEPAGEVFARLKSKGVLVRSFHERGGRLASQLRVTVGTPRENARFLEALRAKT
jgi:histidinol-phosphate aminotransferase